MPRPRKYDYQKDLPTTIFVKVPIELHNRLGEIFTKEELNSLIVKYLSDLEEKNRKKG